MSSDDITRESPRPHPMDLSDAEALAAMAMHLRQDRIDPAIGILLAATSQLISACTDVPGLFDRAAKTMREMAAYARGPEASAAPAPVLPPLDRRDVVIAAFEDVQPVHLDPVGIVAVELHVGTTVTVEIPEEEVADVIGALRSRATMYRADRAHDTLGIAALHASADRLDAIADQLEPRS